MEQQQVAPDLDSLLMACLSNNTEAIKAAEAALKRLTASPGLLPELLTRAANSPSAEVRQLSTVLLRKAVTKHWAKLAVADRAHMQSVLLDRLVSEPHHPVRRSLGHLVGVVARHSVPRGQWPGLLEFLGQCSASADPGHREVALSLLGSLAEHVGEHLAQHVASLQQVVGAGLRDGAVDVRRAAVRVMEPLAGLVADGGAANIEAFHGLVAALLEVATASHAARTDDETLVLCLQLLVELCESSAPLLGKHLPAAVGLAMTVGTDPRAELATREAALEVVHWVARFKPKQLGRNKDLVRQIVAALCTMASEPPPPDLDPEDDGTLPPGKLATQALDAVALNLPSQSVFPGVMSYARDALASPSPSPAHREGALTALAVIFEGCAEPLRRRLKDLMPLLLAGLRDGDARVRGAAAFALGMAAEFLQPDIVEYYKEVLPVLFPLMAEGNADLCERTCYALDTFCEALEGPEIVPYLEQLVSGLGSVLSITGPDVQELALSALASVVSAAGKDFEPYMGPILPVLHHFMSSAAPALLACRYRATETAGLLFESLGAHNAQLKALAPALMELGLQGFKLNSSELREYGHGMFACIAKALASEFAPYLQHCVPLAFESLRLDDGLWGGDDDDDEEDEEDDEEAEAAQDARRAQQLSIRTGVLDEKCAATAALGLYAQAAPAAFLPYVEQTLEVLTKTPGGMCRYFHEEVRVQAAEALPRLVLAVYAACPPPAGATGAAAVTPQVRVVLDAAVKELGQALDDVDSAVVTAALQAFTLLLKQLGVEALGGEVMQLLANAAAVVLKGDAPCQQEPEDDDDDGDDGDEEGGGGDAAEELLAAATDLLPAMAAAAGPLTYAPVFEAVHLPALVSRLKAQQPHDLRSVVVGGLAEVAEVLKPLMAPHLPALLPLLLRELRCGEPINRQNAAFCCGVLAEGCGGAAWGPHCQKLLQALHPLFAATESEGVRDNALGCVARMMASDEGGGAALLPLEAVLPVVLGALPLREDLKEAQAVYGALCGLLTGSQAQRVAALVPQVVAEFGRAAVQRPPLPAGVVAQLARTLAALTQQYPGPMGPLMAAMPAEQRAALEAAAVASAGGAA